MRKRCGSAIEKFATARRPDVMSDSICGRRKRSLVAEDDECVVRLIERPRRRAEHIVRAVKRDRRLAVQRNSSVSRLVVGRALGKVPSVSREVCPLRDACLRRYRRRSACVIPRKKAGQAAQVEPRRSRPQQSRTHCAHETTLL